MARLGIALALVVSQEKGYCVADVQTDDDDRPSLSNGATGPLAHWSTGPTFLLFCSPALLNLVLFDLNLDSDRL